MNFLIYGHCTHFLVGHCHQVVKIIFMVTVPFNFFGDSDHLSSVKGTVTIWFFCSLFIFWLIWVQWPLRFWSLYPWKFCFKIFENFEKLGDSDQVFLPLVGHCTQLLVTVPKKSGHCNHSFLWWLYPVLKNFGHCPQSQLIYDELFCWFKVPNLI